MVSTKRGSFGATVAVGLALVAAWSCLWRHDEDFVSGVPAQPRESVVARCAVDKAMKDRIASVTKTAKLTDAMRVVAAAKVRNAQAGVEKQRPFTDELLSMIKGLVKRLKGSGFEAELPMLRVPEKIKSVGILMITANRGLCGAYNTFIIKKTKARIEDLNKQGIVPKLFIVGKKGLNSLSTRLEKGVEFNYTNEWFSMPDTIRAKDSAEIADVLQAYFLAGEVDKIEISYGRFINLLRNEPSIRTLLPLSPTGIEDPEDETFKLTTEDGKLKVEKEKVKAPKAKEIEADVIFDQPPEVILNSMLPLYLNSQILSLMFDAQASELSSRMSAMKVATDNANDLNKKLVLIYNKKRQAAITAELCEVTAAAVALESTENKAGPNLGVIDNEETISEDFMKELEDGSISDKPKKPEEILLTDRWEFMKSLPKEERF
ncbi:atpG [Symbiodinium natans]|uniref:F-ATPase gamma subunit n=1 Tax=Symbiodinium natans TaxID=878477 RepID=A0A812TLY6_9DINO|nr:atpG [Symbiodinium natans]CAE7528388.1 atpG [Symbiodinium natans]